VASCESLTTQIKSVVEKFDTIKVEINNSSKKMEDYKGEVETKQMEIKLLET
jgi:peptidoglycan hydrolase CwlO-like protein